MLRWLRGWDYKLDLVKDRPAFIPLFHQRLAEFRKAEKGPIEPITRIDLRYDLTSEAYPRVWLLLGTDPSGEPRVGSCERYIIAGGTFRHWAPACHSVLDGKKVKVIGTQGATIVRDEDELYAAVGPFLVEVLTLLRKAKMFSSLPKGPKCYLGVEAEGGEWGWPDYEERERHLA